MIHDKVYDLYCSYDIHYICDMTLICNCASHCICTGTSHFMGVRVWLESTPHFVIDGWDRYRWTKSNRVSRLHETENLCRVIVRRVRHSLGWKTRLLVHYTQTVKVQKVKRRAERLQNPLSTKDTWFEYEMIIDG